MKLSKEDLKKKISEKIVDNDDLVIELLEDIEDSMDVQDTAELDTMKAELDAKDVEIAELKQKYKERFLNGSEEVKVDEESEVVDEGLEKEEVYEEEDIFEEVEE